MQAVNSTWDAMPNSNSFFLACSWALARFSSATVEINSSRRTATRADQVSTTCKMPTKKACTL